MVGDDDFDEIEMSVMMDVVERKKGKERELEVYVAVVGVGTGLFSNNDTEKMTGGKGMRERTSGSIIIIYGIK